MTRTLMMIVRSVLEGAVAMMCFAIRLASDSRMAAQMVDLDGDGMLSFPDIIRVISISSRGEEVDRLTCMHEGCSEVQRRRGRSWIAPVVFRFFDRHNSGWVSRDEALQAAMCVFDTVRAWPLWSQAFSL